MVKRIRIIALLAMLLVGVTTLTALPDHEVYTEFYTDGTYSTQCGYRWVTCGGIIRSGCVTEWSVTYDGGDC